MYTYIRDFSIHFIDTIIETNCYSYSTLKYEPVMHTNLWSLSKNIDEFKVMVKALKNDFDCYVLTETRQICDITVFQMEGYYLLYNEGTLNQNNGAIFVKHNIGVIINSQQRF